MSMPGLDHVRTRDAARAALAHLATTDSRARVLAELRRIAASDVADEGKVCAVGLLAELGEHGRARFADPSGIQRRAAIALAAQLDTASEVAAAADMMVRQLDDDDIIRMLEVMTHAGAHAAAHRLATELSTRLDANAELRHRIVSLLATIDAPAAPARLPRPPRVTVLVDAAARLVVIASRKIAGERRWRRWAVLIDATGRIADCLHDDAIHDDCASLVASLVADGYRVASDDLERAHAIVAAAARVTAPALSSAYYLGRDLLELGEAHAGQLAPSHAVAAIVSTLGRAIELLESGEVADARALLARCEPSADVAAATAACVLAEGGARDALPHLARAIDAEPEWPLHHWNLAVACHRLGDATACYHALRRFVATSATPSGLFGNLNQPGRVALAERLIAQLERTARLSGTTLARPRRKRRTTRATRPR